MAKDFEMIQRQFANAIRFPDTEMSDSIDQVEQRRLKIYRELFFNNVEGFIAGTFPVLKSLVKNESWLKLVRRFFQNHQSETPYFLEISEEFLAFLQQQSTELSQDGIFLPDFALELAHWEWMELVADRTEGDNHELQVPDHIDQDTCYTIQDAAWAVSYQYPVHQASPDKTIEPALTCLLIYRNNQDEVGFVEVNPLSLALFEKLQNNTDKPLIAVLTEIAQQNGLDLDQVLAGGLDILVQWRSLGLLRLP